MMKIYNFTGDTTSSGAVFYRVLNTADSSILSKKLKTANYTTSIATQGFIITWLNVKEKDTLNYFNIQFVALLDQNGRTFFLCFPHTYSGMLQSSQNGWHDFYNTPLSSFSYEPVFGTERIFDMHSVQITTTTSTTTTTTLPGFESFFFLFNFLENFNIKK
jgi:hypothetical protein